VWDNPYDTGIANPSSEPASLKNGLVAYYPFNGNANDESGNGNNGTVNGAILTSDRFGIVERSYFFNGLNSSISLSTINLNDDWSISFFSILNNFIPEVQYQFGFENQLKGIGIVGDPNPCGMPRKFFIYDGASSCNNVLYSNEIVFESKWYHFLVVKNKNSYNLYINGDLSSGNSSIGNISLNKIVVGRRFPDNRFFEGKIDDIRIYNRTLSQEEITYLANN
jgi:hypothetical protein